MNKKILIAFIITIIPCKSFSQGAMIVEDPGMMLQQGVEHAESFGEMMTQTSMFLEDLNMKYSEWSENIKMYEKNVNYPRTKDSWASDFIADCLRVGLTSAPSV